MHHKRWLLLLAVSLFGLIVAVNYLPGTWLTGWDNLHPEFNFPLNITRSIFSVWQEYQGLGVLAGMGHAAALPRELLLWILSLLLPAHLLRYAWTFGMYALGGVGVYVLLRRLIKTHSQAPAVLGALFYLSNLATIQVFAVPFEAFITHFGFLPWFIFSVTTYLSHPTRKNLFLLALIHFLGATHAYIPTLFVVYMFVLCILCIRRVPWKRILLVWLTVFAVNAFWLLPSAYFIVRESRVTVEAKINQMATEEVYLRNRAYGRLDSTIQLKNFLFDTLDFDPQRSMNDPILGDLQTRVETPAITALLLVGFCIVLLGIRGAKPWMVGIFVLSVTMLTTDTPPFSWINALLRQYIPLFHQAFRFPFTKFGILAALSYSLLFGIGSASILSWLHLRHRKLMIAGVIALGILLGIQGYPLLSGSMFYAPMRSAIPQEYMDLFSYLKSAPHGRIANLPQPTFWGWSYYRWGYTGSGFLWYGIKQPILDRAFDVWSSANENYYWQLSLALYRKDPIALSRVLDRYDIRYILLDTNLISPSHNRALFTQEIEAVLPQLSAFHREQTFGALTLYSRTNSESQNFISVRGPLPHAGPVYEWSDEDAAYDALGDYITSDMGYQYPNRQTLFTKREPFATPPVTPEDANLLFDTLTSGVLNKQAVTPCGVLKSGTNQTEIVDTGLRLTTTNDRLCVNFGLGALPHTDGYLVEVQSRNIAGRPLLFSLINQTAKHAEVESYLTGEINYFILPPLAADGLGYNVYVASDAIGRQTTANELLRIRLWSIPYRELLASRTGVAQSFGAQTVILHQAYDPGWVAFEKASAFPFLRPLDRHVLVNNWANGWVVDSVGGSYVFFFLPQLWQIVGFILLPIPFLYCTRRRRHPY